MAGYPQCKSKSVFHQKKIKGYSPLRSSPYQLSGDQAPGNSRNLIEVLAPAFPRKKREFWYFPAIIHLSGRPIVLTAFIASSGNSYVRP
jgi:hypothetical protein